MAVPAAFRASRNRDASAVIRGFVYQVDFTILRWLSLRDQDCLELETGEDIDRVARALETDVERTLEQIKLRNRPITLRNPVALEAIANAAEHFRSNPALNLYFQFTTNARVTAERPNPFRRGWAGILLWESIRTGSLNEQEAGEAIAALRGFLNRQPKPKRVPKSTWDTLKQFVAPSSEVEFAKFIQRFTWSVSEPHPAALTEQIKDRIAETRNADDQQPDEIYRRLFLAVFRLLASGNGRRLTKAGLTEHFRGPPLSSRDSQFVTKLLSELGLLSAKVDSIKDALDQVQSGVNTLVAREFPSGLMLTTAGHVSTESPLQVETLSKRTAARKTIIEQLQNRIWLALHGMADTGKSHLAGLLAHDLGQSAVWIRFGRDTTSDRAVVLLEAGLSQISGLPFRPSGGDWYSEACNNIQPNTVIVLDDLPRMVADDILTHRLGYLIRCCQRRDLRVLSTSLHRLPQRLVSVVGESHVLELLAPPFTVEETSEICSAYGAPDLFARSGGLKLIAAQTFGNPLLITLAARFLKSHHWRLGENELSALLKGEHTATATEEIIGRICQSLDESDRMLLYRLCLAIGSFEEALALLLADVAPPIDRPRETLSQLVGAWVQREDRSRLSVSPLAKGVAKGNITTTTRIACERALAAFILKGPISPWDAQIAMLHLVQAEEFNQAGVLYLSLLSFTVLKSPSPGL